jgi:hypothetical protein
LHELQKLFKSYLQVLELDLKFMAI